MKRTKSVVSVSSGSKRLSREFYNQPSTELGKALLGKVLVRKLSDGGVLRGTIVETEAYPGEHDRASVSYGGKKTLRNTALFMDPGTAFVYLTYGMYHCINISSAEPGGGCLIRAVEPLEDYPTMHRLRERPVKKKKRGNDQEKKTKKPLKYYELCNGPGKLCRAFDIVRDTCDQLDLCTSDFFWIEDHDEDRIKTDAFVIEAAKRIGIDSTPAEARNQLWRYYIRDNLAVSTAKPGEIMKRLADSGADKD